MYFRDGQTLVVSGHSAEQLVEIADRGPIVAPSGGDTGEVVSGVERDLLRRIASVGGSAPLADIEREFPNVRDMLSPLRIKGEEIRIV